MYINDYDLRGISSLDIESQKAYHDGVSPTFFNNGVMDALINLFVFIYFLNFEMSCHFPILYAIV